MHQHELGQEEQEEQRRDGNQWDQREIRDNEVRNCSITEIMLGEKGPGEFVRMGDWDHIMGSFTELYQERLENSTGSA